MGRNNADFNEETSKSSYKLPGHDETMAAFDSLIKSGEAIIDKRKPKPDEE
jgi:hypothetical protein